MKDWFLAGLAVVIVFYALNHGDSRSTVTGNMSPSIDIDTELDALLNVDKSATTIENQTVIQNQTNIEHQTVITGMVPNNITTPLVQQLLGSNTVANGSNSNCITIPGDTITSYGGSGECWVVNNGNVFFVTPTGRRDYIRPANSNDVLPTTATTYTIPPYNRNNMTVEELINEYETKTGKSIPLFFRLREDADQRSWLLTRLIGVE